MKILSISICIFVFVANVYAAKPPRCEDVPITMTFVDPISAPASMLMDDPEAPYVNGVIHYNLFCDGSRDATGGTEPGRVTFMKFPLPVPGSINGAPPSFAGQSEFEAFVGINVRNITARDTGLVIPGSDPVEFYTRVSFSFIGPDGNDYRLAMMPDDSTCPGPVCAPNYTPGPVLPTKNSPEQTAWAKVTYTPSPDTWIVEGEFVNGADNLIQRSTLFSVPGGGGDWIHSGQYSMPFRMVIKSQAPLPVNPSISINDVTITEGNSGNKNATFTISLSEATSNSVAVDFATADGTATAGSDYTSKTGTISIPPGNISATITVSGKGDKVVEPNETFFVNLSNPLSGTIADGEGVCTILNND